MPKALRRIGIFGGSFDPPHLGHLIIAEVARASLELDIVVFVPAFQPPHKAGNHPTTARERLHMTRLLVRGNRALRVSDLELRRRGISYTVDTVEALHKEYPEAKLYLILGGDSLSQFNQWRKPGRIMELASLVVYTRPGSKPRRLAAASGKVIVLKGPLLKVSSSEIRSLIHEGKDIRNLVRENVRRYIRRCRLYT